MSPMHARIGDVDVPAGTIVVAECGGVCSCGTCRVHLESKASREVVGVPTADERDMMQFVGETRADARLSCQIPVIAELNGLVVRVALKQRQI